MSRDRCQAQQARKSSNPCSFLTPEHFVYKPKGEIQTVKGNLCLGPANAADNAALFFTACVKGLVTQVWIIGH